MPTSVDADVTTELFDAADAVPDRPAETAPDTFVIDVRDHAESTPLPQRKHLPQRRPAQHQPG
jgi:hypothetical protein